MAGEKIVLAQLDIDTKSALQKLYETADTITYMKEQQKLLTEEQKKYSSETAHGREQIEKIQLQYQKNAVQLKVLGGEYRTLSKAVQAQTTADGQLLTKEEAVNIALREEQTSVDNVRKANSQLLLLRNSLNPKIQEEADMISKLNQKYDENIEYLKENSSNHELLKYQIGDYKNQIVEAANELNIFNGGFTGFIGRAQQAGGVMPLLANGAKAITQGIIGITRASLAFMATPIGAVITAIGLAVGLLYKYLTSTQEGIDKVTSVTRPLQAIFQSVIGVLQKLGKIFFDTFSNPKQAISDLWDFIKENLWNRLVGFVEFLPKMGEAITLAFKGKFKEAGKVAVDAVAKVATGVENATDKVIKATKATGDFLSEAYKKGQKIDQLQKELDRGQANYIIRQGELQESIKADNRIAEDTTKTLAEREAAAKRSIDNAREINRLNQERLDKEIEILEIKQSLNDTTNEEKVELAELMKKRNESAAQALELETTQNNKLNTIRNEAAKKAEEQKQKAFQDSITKMNLELQYYEQTNGAKRKSFQEEITAAQEVYNKKVSIANKEYEASKKTENDKLKLKVTLNQLEIDLAQKKANAVIQNMDEELQIYLINNQTKIKENERLNEKLVEDEKERLDEINELSLNSLNQRLADQLISQIEYDQQVLALHEETESQKAEISKKYDKQIQDEKSLQRQLEHEAELLKLDEDGWDSFNRKQLIADQQYQIEKEKLEQQLADGLISQENFNLAMTNLETQKAQSDKKIEDAKAAYKVDVAKQTLGNLATIAGKETAFGKAAAIAQTTIDTYQAATSAFKSLSGIPIVGPALGAVAAAAAVAMGVKNIQKITSTKEPKMESGGALQMIGGKRHSQGGTKFVGSDGTRFEAEQGEIIGVMNRNAARHFMAFNNAFPFGGGSAGGVFESGGVVSRDITGQSVDLDVLAMKVAEANRSLPAPVVSVEDIITTGNRTVSVQQNASF